MTEETTNRLAGESSPYLLLHRHNPVDWYPWGEEALARASDEDKPIFLSVGYSTCYWCHVMERESFSTPAVAELMNRDFVNIKVDREERPELDEIYMAATQIVSGHGGWPNSVFLTPDLRPFYAGTYFPPIDRQGMPGFATVLRGLADAWKTRRDDIDRQAADISDAMRRYLEQRGAAADELPGAGVVRRALADLERQYDPRHGGFGGAPKFPTPANLLLLTEVAASDGAAAGMLSTTLERMARGGIYDQLGGGFHRYSTDAEWLVPHFEKMLYDNGFLLELYAREAARTGDPEAARVARATATWIEREMTAPEGAFWSAQDAETDGREGAFYVWSREQLKEVLGEEEFGFLAPLYGFDGAANFEGKEYVLHLPRSLGEQAERRRLERDELLAQMAPLAARLLEARGGRKRPLTDDKVLADWNGIAIAGLATAGRLLTEPAMVELAVGAARFVLRRMRPEGELLHAWRDGRAHIPAFLGDYAHVIRGLLALERATGSEEWLAAAVELAGEQRRRLGDPAGGYFVAADRPDVLFRSKEIFDGATPGANSIAVLNLLALAERTGDDEWRREAETAMKAFAGLVESHTQATRMMVVAVRRLAVASGDDPAERDAATAGSSRGATADDVVTWEAEVGTAGGDGWAPLAVRVAIAPGWHLYAPAARAAGLDALTLTRAGAGLELADLEYPAGVERELAPGAAAVAVYEGSLELRGRVRGAGELRLRYQACDDRHCRAPVELAVRVESDG